MGRQRGLTSSRTNGNPLIFNRVHSWNSCGHFQFLCGCYAADAHVRAVVVASPSPLRGVILRLLDAFDDLLVQPFVPNGAVVALDTGVLLGLAGLDGNPMFLSPFHQRFTDVFGVHLRGK
jgi:hypothetical protein